MKNVSTELRDLWRSLADAEGDTPGFDYDRGYLTGWHDRYRGIRRIRPNGDYRDPQRVHDFRAGYAHGRADGERHPAFADWWPDFARGAAADITRRDAEYAASQPRNAQRGQDDPEADSMPALPAGGAA